MSNWKLPDGAVWQETAPGANYAQMLRHPSAPFVCRWDETKKWKDLARIANAYLERVAARIGLEKRVLDELRKSVDSDSRTQKSGGWAWLTPCSQNEPSVSNSMADKALQIQGSYFLCRSKSGTTGTNNDKERTFVLLGQGPAAASGNDTVRTSGIRIVMHLDAQGENDNPSIAVRITGVTTSLAGVTNELEAENDAEVPEGQFLPKGSTNKPAHMSASNTKVTPAFKFCVFDQDPVSKNGPASFEDFRPNRTSEKFDGQRRKVKFDVERADNKHVELRNPWVVVIKSPFVESDGVKVNDPKAVKTIEVNSAPAVRTNDAAALSAFYHTDQFIKRIRAYGFDPNEFLRGITLPLRVSYRGGAGVGEDRGANAINARVRRVREVAPQSSAKASSSASKPERFRADINFALADRSLSPATHPLGIACDPRWCWHEMGHVLLIGTTGAREFRFAHSPGDSLAAILSDPRSKLAEDETWRGMTFPWVQTKRRHDRKVEDGWSWTGPMCQREVFYGSPGADRNAYWAEQLLSSTLFRLYRALGGDSNTKQDAKQVPDVLEREAAAEYTAYLIMRAVALLGPASVLEARTPDELVSALIDADIGTSTFIYPVGARPRVGGTAHKVIRWAFLAQGLYAGRANEPVDIFIPDRRSPDKGEYPPVSFHSKEWHASDKGMRCERTGEKLKVQVTVQNGPGSKATDVSVSLYWVSLKKQDEMPAFSAKSWQTVKPSKTRIIGAGKAASFNFILDDVPEGKTAILASATCPADRSNIDKDAMLPCQSIACPVDYLVAGDNNLALLVHP